jgi:hypothetical protein
MNRQLAAERGARDLAASIRDHLVHVHVELRSAARHPDVKGKHVVMLARENLVADVDDQLVDLAVETTAGIIRVRRRLLQDRVGLDHFARHQVPADAEMLQRALRLRTPELVRGNVHFTQAVCLFTEVVHPYLSWQLMSESTLAVLIESVRTAR